jgi:hypothetical protein
MFLPEAHQALSLLLELLPLSHPLFQLQLAVHLLFLLAPLLLQLFLLPLKFQPVLLESHLPLELLLVLLLELLHGLDPPPPLYRLDGCLPLLFQTCTQFGTSHSN